MKIAFLVNEVAGGWHPTDTRLGGTEESVVKWAEELARFGHDVEVFGIRDNMYLTENLLDDTKTPAYFDRQAYFMRDPDITINVKSSEVTRGNTPMLYLTNETNASDLDLSSYDGVIWPSEWAMEEYPVNNPVKYILPHGYDPKQIYAGDKVSKQCLYASSPDRGLETLLRAWPKVRAAHPDATLRVTYDAPPYEMEGVEFLNGLNEEEMSRLYRESEFWCHPCNGGELYCITGIKAQAAGCIPVIIPKMALQETVKHGYFTDEENYADTLIKALGDSKQNLTIYKALAKEIYPTWQYSTDRLLKIIELTLAG